MKIFNLLLKSFFIFSIKCYQKYISPYKGFKCAHKAHTYGMSCSTYGLFAFNNYSVKDAIVKIEDRLKSCKEIHTLYKTDRKSLSGKLIHQAGAIDCPDISDCDCDIGSGKGKGCSSCIDIASVGDCSLFDRKSKSPVSTNFNYSKKQNKRKKDNPFYNFLLLDETSNHKIFKHSSGRYFQIQQNHEALKEEDILNNKSSYSRELTNDELKNFFQQKSSVSK